MIDKIKGLTKYQHLAMVALFDQDLPGGKRAKVSRRTADSLVKLGLADYRLEILGTVQGRPFVGSVLQLTTRGHFTYCTWADRRAARLEKRGHATA